MNRLNALAFALILLLSSMSGCIGDLDASNDSESDLENPSQDDSENDSIADSNNDADNSSDNSSDNDTGNQSDASFERNFNSTRDSYLEDFELFLDQSREEIMSIFPEPATVNDS